MTQKYTAIVTGASSGIGRAISEKLGVLGYEVFGIGRRFDTEEDRDIAGVLQCENDLKNAIFHPIICDLTDTDKLCAIVKQVTSEHTVKVLVNNAGAAYYGLHEELNPKKIQEMVRVNLEAPLILTQQLLRTLKKTAVTLSISHLSRRNSQVRTAVPMPQPKQDLHRFRQACLMRQENTASK
mgnify:CR=1 FL=1